MEYLMDYDIYLTRVTQVRIYGFPFKEKFNLFFEDFLLRPGSRVPPVCLSCHVTHGGVHGTTSQRRAQGGLR